MKNKKSYVLISSIVPIILLILLSSVIHEKMKEDNMYENGQLSNTYVNQTYTNDTKTENNGIENTIVVDNIKEENNINNNNENESSHDKVLFNSTVAFIGDSRTQGFIMYNGLKEVQDYSYIGLMVDTAVTKKFLKTDNGKKITILQDMKNKDIKKVYIMLGINELGWSYPSVFKLKYCELIDEIRKIKPDCKIYVQSIIPVIKSKDTKDKIYNNKNIKKFNKLIKEVSQEKNVKYLDVQSVLVDKNGYLPEEASTDGIHIGKSYCTKWLEYLKNNS